MKAGDHVVCSWSPNCGHCYYCDLDEPILCEAVTAAVRNGHPLDGTSRLSVRGEKVHHFSTVSSHAEHCVVPVAGAVPMPAELPFDRACLLGCGVTTGIAAAVRCAHGRPGSSVAVMGGGAVGLNVLQGARLCGAHTIVAVDVNDRHLAMAPRFGATHVVDARREDVAPAVRALTGGRGADYVFEAAGHEASLQQSFESARPGAAVVILGNASVAARVSLRFGSLMGEKRIVRSSYGGARPRLDFPTIARAYLDGTVLLDELITRRLALAQINDGFDAMERGEITRAVLML